MIESSPLPPPIEREELRSTGVIVHICGHMSTVADGLGENFPPVPYGTTIYGGLPTWLGRLRGVRIDRPWFAGVRVAVRLARVIVPFRVVGDRAPQGIKLIVRSG